MTTDTTPKIHGSRPLATAIAITLGAMKRCDESANTEWRDRHYGSLDQMQRDLLPHGGGIDGTDTPLDRERSTPEKLVFNVEVHDMDENGFYCGWLHFKITVRPSLQFGLDIRITGRDSPRDWKEHLHQFFGWALRSIVGQRDDGRWVFSP